MVLTEKLKTRAEGLYWIWLSKALIKHELVSLLPYMYCSLSSLPPLTVSYSLRARADLVFLQAPPKWQNDWVMYECNSACCDVRGEAMRSLSRVLQTHRRRDSWDALWTLRCLHCSSNQQKNVLFAGPEMTKHISMGCHYCRYTNQEIRRVFCSVFRRRFSPELLQSESKTTVWACNVAVPHIHCYFYPDRFAYW